MADDNGSGLWSSLDSVSTTDLVGSLYNTTRTPSNTLDKDAFLQLLITQMKYQDPLNPMDDKEFMGQMAQFSALEQMQNLNANVSKSQAYAMIGKTVSGTYWDSNAEEYVEVTGLVSAVTTKGSETYLYVDGNDLPLSSVSVVGDDYFTAQQLDAIYTSVSNTRDTSLIGKHVQALIMDDSGNVKEYVEGVVNYVKFNGSQSVLVVGNKEVYPSEVASVSDKPLLIGKSVIVPVTKTDEDGQTTTEWEKREITGVTIKDKKAYLDFGDMSVPIDKINYIMESLDYVGQTIKYNSYDGKVTSITIKNGIPYFNIGDKELSYLEFAEAKAEGKTESKTEDQTEDQTSTGS